MNSTKTVRVILDALTLSSSLRSFNITTRMLLDILGAEEIDEDEVALAKVIHTVLHQEVLRQALLEVDALLIRECHVNGLVDLELLLAEADGVPHFVG